MIKLKVIFLFVVACLPLKAQENASLIFKKATSQQLTTNMELDIEINEVKRNGRTIEKSFNVLLAKFEGEEKIKTKIIKPERAKGITIVLTQYPDKLGLIEIFTPANGKIRKMKATKSNIKLVGSGSLISNYISKSEAELDLRYITKEQVNGKSCHKIEVNDATDSNNGKADFFIAENTFNILKIVSYDKNKTIETITELTNFKTLGAKVHPQLIETKNLKDKSRTQIKVVNLTPKDNLKTENFNLKTN